MTLNELTNNQKRKEFLDKYTGWNLWLAVPEVSEKYYSYLLPDNTMIIVKETEHTKGDDCWKDTPNITRLTCPKRSCVV